MLAAGELVPDYLGDKLAPWLLPGFDAPRLPNDPGSAVLLFRGERDPLAPGFALPVIWLRGHRPAAPRLPNAILEQAGRVVRFLHVSGYYLDLHPCIDAHYGLAELPLTTESVALPLALALRLATLPDGPGRPSPCVLATGALNEDGYVSTVDGYEHKVPLAARLMAPDAEGHRWLFVPQADLGAAKEEAKRARTELDVLGLRGEVPDCLGAALARLDAEPPDAATLEDLCEYGNRPHVRASYPVRSSFYARRLAQALGARLAESPEWPLRSALAVERLLLPVSLAPDNALLSVAAIRPRELKLITTSKSLRAASVVADKARSWGVEVTDNLKVFIEERDVRAEDVQAAVAWLSERRPSVVDFTPGTREVLALCVEAGRQAGSDRVYVKLDYFDDNRPRFGTERLRVLPTAGD